MGSKIPRSIGAGLGGALALAFAWAASAQDAPLLTWSQTAARGAFDLCRADAPDAARVADHGQIWGWPPFAPYLEHPDGYKREAGGESRRTFASGGASATVEMTVQSGEVTGAAPADILYFRCNIAADQPIGPDLEAYFTGLYGPPTSKGDGEVLWLLKSAAGAGGGDDAGAMKQVIAAGAGAEGLRIELTRERGLDRAKLTLFRNAPAA